MGKPKQEFLGADARGFKFSIVLDATLGVKPRKTMERIEKMIETGYVDYLVIGNKAIGNNRFCITSMSEEWNVVYAGGELVKATIDLTFKEYT